jgi:hypothetical protein
MAARTATAEEWDRRRLLRTLLVVAAVGIILLGGLGYAVYGAVISAGRSAPTGTPSPIPGLGHEAPEAAQTGGETVPAGKDVRDAIAAAAMLRVAPEDSRRGIPTYQPLPTITIPAAGTGGPALVTTGYPHTPEGAIGQLAAIETSVLQMMTLEYARAVWQAWSAPGSPAGEAWELTANVQAFLASTAGQQAGTGTTSVTAIPTAGQVKGTDGPDWVLACVLLDIRATAATSARIAYGHCERMQWSGTRWLIATGSPPAPAPSTWPGTELARSAGWRTWVPITPE